MRKGDAYESQSISLGPSNVRGQRCENIVRDLTHGNSLKLPYSDVDNDVSLQSDCVLACGTDKELIFSVTHTRPDSPGHSNENKFQLKLGEMWLWKTHKPNRRVVIVLCGREDQWLPWCLTAFKFFFDDAIYEWEPDFEKRIMEAFDKTPNRHQKLWANEVLIRNEREKIAHSFLYANPTLLAPRFSRLRHRMFEEVVPQFWQAIDHPDQITSTLLKNCMQVAHGKNGKEWLHFRKTDNSGIDLEAFWQSRTYFNPAEAAIDWALTEMKIPFAGGIAKDVEIPSFMSALAKVTNRYAEFNRTKMSEDFVLKQQCEDGDERLVYIQSKSSGGGLIGHGKAIQNRAKEQIARNILYRLRPRFDVNGHLSGFYDVGSKFKWIAVIDNNWALPKKNPTKNLHSLFLAGYDSILYADQLVDGNLEPIQNSSLKYVLHSLCLNPNGDEVCKFVEPEVLEIFTTHDEGEHGLPGASDGDFDY